MILGFFFCISFTYPTDRKAKLFLPWQKLIIKSVERVK